MAKKGYSDETQQQVFDMIKEHVGGRVNPSYFYSSSFDRVVEAVANEMKKTKENLKNVAKLEMLETAQARDKYRLALIYEKMAHHSYSELYEKTTYNRGLASILSGVALQDITEED